MLEPSKKPPRTCLCPTPTGDKAPQLDLSSPHTVSTTAQHASCPLGIFSSSGRPCEGQQAIKPRHLPGIEPSLNREGGNKIKSMAQTPGSAAHLLFRFFHNLISTGDRVPTTTIDSRFWFRFLGFIVSLMSLLLWFPLKKKLFIISTKYKSKIKSFKEV